MGQRQECRVFGGHTPHQSKAQRNWHWTPITPSLLSLHPPALPAPLLAPRKEDSLEKAVGRGNQPEGVNEDGSADVRAPEQQAGLPRPPARQHVPAAVDPPHRLGLPTHCGDTPPSMTETPVTPNDAVTEALLHVTGAKTKAKGQGAWVARPCPHECG